MLIINKINEFASGEIDQILSLSSQAKNVRIKLDYYFIKEIDKDFEDFSNSITEELSIELYFSFKMTKMYLTYFFKVFPNLKKFTLIGDLYSDVDYDWIINYSKKLDEFHHRYDGNVELIIQGSFKYKLVNSVYISKFRSP